MQDVRHRSHEPMAPAAHVAWRHHNRYCARPGNSHAEVHNDMPQALIVIFLLFFAVLAFGWFYLQRAKARTETTSASTTAAPAAAAAPAATATEHADHADHADHTDHTDHAEHGDHSH